MSTPTDQKEVDREKADFEKGEILPKAIAYEFPLKMSHSTNQQVSTERGESSADPEKGESTEKVEVEIERKEAFEKACTLVETIYHKYIDHPAFTIEEMISDMQIEISTGIIELNQLLKEYNKSKAERSMFEYLKGRLHSAIPGVYSREAELHLTNATNLDPDLLMAWNWLGTCVSYNGEYVRAKACIERCLEKAESVAVLCQLADLELGHARVLMGAVGQNVRKHINGCIKYAERAIERDATDSHSLFVLGKAYYTSFYFDGGWNQKHLLLSAETLEKAVCRFLQNYKDCLCYLEKFQSFSKGSQQKQLILKLLGDLKRAIQEGSERETKRKSKTETSLYSLIQPLANIDVNVLYERATLSMLTEGDNQGVATIAAVWCLVNYEIATPSYYVVCDSNENSFALVVFGIKKEVIKQGDSVTIMNPYCTNVDFKTKNKSSYKFKCVCVHLLGQVHVNGNPLSSNFIIREPILEAEV